MNSTVNQETGRSGKISVSTNDIFPIIKKWLYSEHDIFLRELISNATDAITKRQTLSQMKNLQAETPKITVEIDKDNKKIIISDNGLGMTEEEVEKYIAQLAFSGAEEFVQKMKETSSDVKNQVIGKFGLGFYSAFMCASTVEIESLSMNEGSKATKWICQGETDYQFYASEKATVGTTITLSINDESLEFLESYKTRSVLKNYCDFMPYPIELIDLKSRKETIEHNEKATKDEEKKPLDIDIINAHEPLWKKDPSTLTDKDYETFYSELFPMEAPALFWIHLNIDHPFELKGILYFPKVNPSKPFNEKNIRLYNKQVFVSDNVKEVIPEFLSMLKGVIDSSDIPLNVSRSALQGDPNIKKISNYIVKKVTESLKKLFNNDRAKFETIWPEIALFVKYGTISDEKFDEVMRSMLLFKNSEEKWITFKEYQESIPSEFKEKMGETIITFEKNQSDESLKKQLLAKGVHTIETEQFIDPHLTQHCEYKKVGDHNLKFASIDTEFEKLIESETLDAESIQIKEMVEEILKDQKENLSVEARKIENSTSAAYIKVDQQMKRFQQMSKSMGNGDIMFPVKKTLMLNLTHPVLQNAWKLWQKNDKKALATKLIENTLDLARISSEGLEGQNREKFIERTQDLLKDLSGLAL